MSQPRPIRACLIDLDGTLVDTLGDFHMALNDMLAALNKPLLERAQIALWVGRGTEYLLNTIWAYVGVTDEVRRQRGRAVYLQAYERLNGRYSNVFGGVREGLQMLRSRGLPLVCLTNKPVAFARSLLQTMALSSAFAHVYGGDSFERRKPDPLPLLKACQVIGVPAENTLMVGDSINDTQAARAAGCAVALMRYGYNHGVPVEQVDADAYFDTLVDLATWIDTCSVAA